MNIKVTFVIKHPEKFFLFLIPDIFFSQLEPTTDLLAWK
jgi:hypothetical protein